MDERDETSPRANGSGPGQLDPTSDPTPLATEQVKIAAVEAAVAAGLQEAPGTEADEASGAAGEPQGTPGVQVPELPDWADPPTGQVPRVLLEEGADEPGLAGAARGPLWRERADDWDDDLGLGLLDEAADETTGVAGRLQAGSSDDPFGFDELEVAATGPLAPGPPTDRPQSVEVGGPLHGGGEEGLLDADDAAWAAFVAGGSGFAGGGSAGLVLGPGDPPAGSAEEVPLALPPAGQGRRRRRAERERLVATRDGRELPVKERSSRARPARSRPTTPAAGSSRRNPLVATATGVGVGAVAVACFLGGAVSALALVAFVATLAAGEAYGTLRQGGRRPATFVGLVSVPALVVGAYLFGARTVPVVAAACFLFSAVWYLAQAGRARSKRSRPPASPAADLGATLLVACWVGILGSFAGLLLSPRSFPDRHGVAFLLAAVALTAAHDVGSYAAGATLGRHRVLPTVSPKKSWEGLLGGSALAFLVASTILVRVHPIDLGTALVLAALVCVLGPLGDLTESLVKRDLGVKDMGNLLPAHGGLFDRIDAILVVLPAAYLLFKVAHLS